jgi:pyruvate-ferredoxin/flavodoxin oxidoreductase
MFRFCSKTVPEKEADELFAAAQENAQWRYRSYLRMLSTNWDKE